MEKLVLTRRKPKPKNAERNSTIMRVRTTDYDKLSELSFETGIPMIQLMSLLLEYAIENLEIEEA